ncbi:MAG: B12-binding domain-containing radical SAM protein [Chloroflexi bacterium]|nr:B12-binding domain-containing radical SAM protein [Chloroflexota bacterium]
MTSVLLIYPYFRPSRDRSIFRFPPLGIAYLAAALQKNGYRVGVLDCTFLNREDALKRVVENGVDIVGIYVMVTMKDDATWFARNLRQCCKMLVAGGPLPSSDPVSFLDDFDLAVRGEGERTIVEIAQAYEGARSLESISGLAYRQNSQGAKADIVFTTPRLPEPDLDSIAFPARELLPNEQYIRQGRQKFGKATTSIITTRGCPFNCEFCSNAVFGVSYRQRSPKNVVDEMEQALALGYDRVHFADDVFTLRKDRLLGIIDEIKSRGLRFEWECLSRVDSMDPETARLMRDAGCDRVFFGIESANESVLKIMRKNITVEKARRAVEIARRAGIKSGAFFILGYPGDTETTILETVKFASSLPLDYLSFTMPYPIPGTALFERVKQQITRNWNPMNSLLSEHTLTFQSDFSEGKLKFAILKGKIQFRARKKLGRAGFFLARPFEFASNLVFRLLK